MTKVIKQPDGSFKKEPLNVQVTGSLMEHNGKTLADAPNPTTVPVVSYPIFGRNYELTELKILN